MFTTDFCSVEKTSIFLVLKSVLNMIVCIKYGEGGGWRRRSVTLARLVYTIVSMITCNLIFNVFNFIIKHTALFDIIRFPYSNLYWLCIYVYIDISLIIFFILSVISINATPFLYSRVSALLLGLAVNSNHISRNNNNLQYISDNKAFFILFQ